MTAGLARFGVAAFSGSTEAYDVYQALLSSPRTQAQRLRLALKTLNNRSESALGRALRR